MSHSIEKAIIQRFGPPALVVAGAYRNENEHWRGEFFLLLPGERTIHAKGRIGFDAEHARELAEYKRTVPVLNELTIDAAKYEARLALDAYLAKRYAQHTMIPSRIGSIGGDGEDLLIQLAIRGEANAIEQVIEETGCRPLASILKHILRIVPALHREASQ